MEDIDDIPNSHFEILETSLPGRLDGRYRPERHFLIIPYICSYHYMSMRLQRMESRHMMFQDSSRKVYNRMRTRIGRLRLSSNTRPRAAGSRSNQKYAGTLASDHAPLLWRSCTKYIKLYNNLACNGNENRNSSMSTESRYPRRLCGTRGRKTNRMRLIKDYTSWRHDVKSTM